MKEILSLIQDCIMYAGVALLLGMLFVALLKKMEPQLLELGRICRKSVPFAILLIVAIIYGATKNITSKTSTDENIDLLFAGIEISNKVETVEGVVTTNFYSATLVLKVSPDSSEPKPMWFRESRLNTWTNVTNIATFDSLAPVFDPDSSGNGTNVFKWVSYDWSNNWNHAQWYIGTDPPAVEVDIDDDNYIIIDEFCMTSKRVRIKFHLNPAFNYPEGTTIAIQRKVEYRRFETVDEFIAIREGVYEWHGFEVGKRTEWRLHIAVTKEN